MSMDSVRETEELTIFFRQVDVEVKLCLGIIATGNRWSKTRKAITSGFPRKINTH